MKAAVSLGCEFQVICSKTLTTDDYPKKGVQTLSLYSQNMISSCLFQHSQVLARPQKNTFRIGYCEGAGRFISRSILYPANLIG